MTTRDTINTLKAAFRSVIESTQSQTEQTFEGIKPFGNPDGEVSSMTLIYNHQSSSLVLELKGQYYTIKQDDSGGIVIHDASTNSVNEGLLTLQLASAFLQIELDNVADALKPICEAAKKVDFKTYLIDAVKELGAAQVQIDRLKITNDELTASIANHEQTANANATKITQLKTENQTLSEELTELRDTVQKLESSTQADEKAQLEKTIEELETANRTLKTQNDNLQQQLDNAADTNPAPTLATDPNTIEKLQLALFFTQYNAMRSGPFSKSNLPVTKDGPENADTKFEAIGKHAASGAQGGIGKRTLGALIEIGLLKNNTDKLEVDLGAPAAFSRGFTNAMPSSE